MTLVSPPTFEPPHRVVPAWLLSIIFHVVLLTIVGWVTKQEASGTSSEVDRPIGIAMVERMPDRNQYTQPEEQKATADDASDRAAEPTSATTAASLAPANMAPPVDLAGVLQEMTSGDIPNLSSGTADGVFGTGSELSGNGRPKATGSPATTMVFGVSGSGSRFIYVFDRSDSMNGFGGRPLRAAKKELQQSIQSLTEGQQFQIIFYNDDAKPFVPAGSPLSLLRGESTMIRRASQYVDSVKAFGGTEHFGALQMALRMGPDVIFFLTDARVPSLTSRQMADLRVMADRAGTSIHAIEFGPESSAPESSFLIQLAAENRGEYRYIAIDDLFFEPLTPTNPDAVAP
jgi:hypothetical protein